MDLTPAFKGITTSTGSAQLRSVAQSSVGHSSMGKTSSTCESLGSSDNISAQPTCAASDIEGGNGLKTSLKSSVFQASQPKEGARAGTKAGDWKFFGASVNQYLKVDEVVEKIESGRLWVVNGRRRNGLIVLREFHAEFAGPGAAVGGDLDQDIVKIIPIGKLSLLEPDSHEAHQNAIKIRLQWIRLTQNFTDQPNPDDRARMILEQFKTYFDQDTVDSVPDEAFALLVGVLPQTIHRVRSGFV
jgi:hypothetical protein